MGVSMDELYKRDTTGKVRVWTTEVEGDMHRTITGVVDGKMVVSKWSQCKPKNVGKVNETSGHEQAVAESSAKHTKQIAKGYFSNIDDIDGGTLFKPMLANDYAKLKNPIDFPVTSQPKLDGIRCIAKADGLWTRTGKPHMAIPHIWEAVKGIFEEFPDMILDGELYNHDLKDDFNSIVSLVRKSKPSEEDLAESAKLVQYHVYDIQYDLYDETKDLNFVFRKTSYINIVRKLDIDCIVPVANAFIQSQVELDEVYARYISEGYEGQMVRLDGLYENKRSKNLLKRKEFITEEFGVVGVEEGLGNWSGCVKRFNLVNEHNVYFNAGVRGTQVQLADLLNNKKCPDWATLRYFELSPDGIPRFPIVIDYGWDGRDD
jgi:DNA ligase-1